MRGVLVVIYANEDVDILAVSDANYQRFLPHRSEKIRVMQAKKATDASLPPPGVQEVLEKLSKCQKVVFSGIVQSNLTEKLTFFLQKSGINPERIHGLDSLRRLPAALFPSLKHAVGAAQQSFASAAEMLAKKAPKLSAERIVSSLEAIEKSAAFSTYHAQNSVISISSTL